MMGEIEKILILVQSVAVQTNATRLGEGDVPLSADVWSNSLIRRLFDDTELMGPRDYPQRIGFALSLLAVAPDLAEKEQGLSNFLMMPRTEYLLGKCSNVTLLDELRLDAIADMRWCAPSLSELNHQTLAEIKEVATLIPTIWQRPEHAINLGADLQDFERFIHFAALAKS